MCEIMDNLYKKKAKEDRKQMVVEMLKDGKLSYEDIAKYSGLMNKLNEKAAKEAVRNNQINTALSMIKTGKLTFEEIALCSGLTLEEVKALAEGQPA